MVGVKVGDKFEWNRHGAVCQVTAVRGRKIKFEVFGGVPLFGTMNTKQFIHQFKGKKL